MALLRKETCDVRHHMGLRHPVQQVYSLCVCILRCHISMCHVSMCHVSMCHVSMCHVSMCGSCAMSHTYVCGYRWVIRMCVGTGESICRSADQDVWICVCVKTARKTYIKKKRNAMTQRRMEQTQYARQKRRKHVRNAATGLKSDGSNEWIRSSELNDRISFAK